MIQIQEAQFNFVRLDGSMNHAQREKVLEDFNSKKDVRGLLLSLKVMLMC